MAIGRGAQLTDKTLALGKTEGGGEGEMEDEICVLGIADSADTSLGKLRETVADRGAHAAGHGVRHD